MEILRLSSEPRINQFAFREHEFYKNHVAMPRKEDWASGWGWLVFVKLNRTER